MLHEIRAVAKAEPHPVVVDESTGVSMNVPPTLMVKGEYTVMVDKGTEHEHANDTDGQR